MTAKSVVSKFDTLNIFSTIYSYIIFYKFGKNFFSSWRTSHFPAFSSRHYYQYTRHIFLNMTVDHCRPLSFHANPSSAKLCEPRGGNCCFLEIGRLEDRPLINEVERVMDDNGVKVFCKHWVWSWNRHLIRASLVWRWNSVVFFPLAQLSKSSGQRQGACRP